MTVAGHDDDETTAAVVAPKRNDKCPDGRVIISSGPRLKNDPAAPQFQLPGRGTLNFPAVLVRDLNGPGNLKEVALPAPTPFGDYNMVSSDSQLIRLANDDILLIYAVAARPALTDPKALAAFNVWKDFTLGWRSGFLIWRTSDCGDTWSQPTLAVDSATVTTVLRNPAGQAEEVVGAFGWPQGSPAGPWIGGYDMQWAYTDPWRPNSLYIGTIAVGGTATDEKGQPKFPGRLFNKIVIFASHDGGATWDKLNVLLPNPSGIDYPVTMTSLPPNQRHPEGRLFAFRCLYDTGEPRLYWSDDRWKTLAGESAVYYGGVNDPEAKCTAGLDQQKLPGGGLRYSGGIALSRVKSDATRDWVRVAYPAVTSEGRQVERLVLVEIERKPGSSQESVKVKPAVTYDAQNKGPGGHVLYATFIEPDHVELKDDDVNTAVLYWAETTPFGTVYMRYAVVSGGGADSVGNWSEPRDLSVANGARRQWVMNSGDWFGDYFKGAFYMDGLQLKYLAQWAERRPGANRGVSYNIVTVQP
jgi:hypothetical protein